MNKMLIGTCASPIRATLEYKNALTSSIKQDSKQNLFLSARVRKNVRLSPDNTSTTRELTLTLVLTKEPISLLRSSVYRTKTCSLSKEGKVW
jgi:hypothetical protein